jgi:glutamine amidotransferase
MSKLIAIVDYGMGNVRSVVNAFEFIGAKVKLTDKASDLNEASAIVVPGQGAFRDCIKCLKENKFIEALNQEVFEKGKLYFGICLGMQILGEKSFEGGEFTGLGWIKGVVKQLKPKKNLKIPHLGWNEVKTKRQLDLFRKITDMTCFYFAHSYVLYPEKKNTVVATTDYGGEFPVAIYQGNIIAVQFHPEKSQQGGLQLISNFVQMV